MASKSFFSGRIPQELYDKAEEYCEATGKSKTELLITALSTMLDFPVIIPNPLAAEITKEAFEALEQRVQILEQHSRNQNSVIKYDNNDNMPNSLLDNVITDNDNNVIKVLDPLIIQDENTEKLTDNNNDKVIDNKYVQIQNTKYEEYIQINTTQVSNISNLTRRQIQTLLSKAIEQLKQQNKLEEPGCLLPQPVEVFHKNGIEVNSYPYKLFYVGENSNERPLWNLVPDEDKPQQTVITVINDSYDANNK